MCENSRKLENQEIADEVNEDILADVGTPQPIDDYSTEIVPSHLFAATGDIIPWGAEDVRKALHDYRECETRQQEIMGEIIENKGWQCLGYDNLKELLDAEFDGISKSTAYHQAKCAVVIKNLRGHFAEGELKKLRGSHLAAIAELEEAEEQRQALVLIQSRAAVAVYHGQASKLNGRITEKICKDVVMELRHPTLTEKAQTPPRAPEKRENPAPLQSAIDDPFGSTDTPPAVAAAPPVVNSSPTVDDTAMPTVSEKITELELLEVVSTDLGMTLVFSAMDEWGEKYTLSVPTRDIRDAL